MGKGKLHEIRGEVGFARQSPPGTFVPYAQEEEKEGHTASQMGDHACRHHQVRIKETEPVGRPGPWKAGRQEEAGGGSSFSAVSARGRHHECWPEFPQLRPAPCLGYVGKPGIPLPAFSSFPRPIPLLPPPGSPPGCSGLSDLSPCCLQPAF